MDEIGSIARMLAERRVSEVAISSFDKAYLDSLSVVNTRGPQCTFSMFLLLARKRCKPLENLRRLLAWSEVMPLQTICAHSSIKIPFFSPFYH